MSISRNAHEKAVVCGLEIFSWMDDHCVGILESERI